MTTAVVNLNLNMTTVVVNLSLNMMIVVVVVGLNLDMTTVVVVAAINLYTMTVVARLNILTGDVKAAMFSNKTAVTSYHVTGAAYPKSVADVMDVVAKNSNQKKEQAHLAPSFFSAIFYLPA